MGLAIFCRRDAFKMTSSSNSPSNRWLAVLVGPWPVVALLACYLTLGLSAASRKTVTGDEGTHLLGGYSYWRSTTTA